MIQETITKHRNCLIERTPSEQFPDLVTVVKTPKVKEIFKGNVQDYIQDGYLTMNNGWSLCGDFFKPGDKILFFAYEGSEGTLATSTCSLNRRYLTDEDFLIERRELKKATRGKFIGIF